MPKYRSEDKDHYIDPPETYEELSVQETLKNSGLDSLGEAQKRALRRGTSPACCTCGSYVEPDGECPHGNPSVLRKEGLI